MIVCNKCFSSNSYNYGPLHNLLLDKETLQVTQLVETSSNQNNQLNHSPLQHPAVGGFRLVSENSFSVSNVFLFSVDVLQLLVQVLDLLGQVVDLVRTLGVNIFVSGSHHYVKVDSVLSVSGSVVVEWGQTELVFSFIGRSECEFPVGCRSLRNHPVVVVECFIHSNHQTQLVIGGIQIGSLDKFMHQQLTHNQGVSRQFFIETTGFCGVQIKVQPAAQLKECDQQSHNKFNQTHHSAYWC